MASTWVQFEAQEASKIKKIYKKRDHILYVIFDWFFIDFGSLLGGFLVDFQCQVEGQVDKKSIIWPLVGKLAEIAKILKNLECVAMFLASSTFQLRSKIDKKASPDRSKIKQKIGQPLHPIFNWKAICDIGRFTVGILLSLESFSVSFFIWHRSRSRSFVWLVLFRALVAITLGTR